LIADVYNQTAQKQFITTNKGEEYTITELNTTTDFEGNICWYLNNYVILQHYDFLFEFY